MSITHLYFSLYILALNGSPTAIGLVNTLRGLAGLILHGRGKKKFDQSNYKHVIATMNCTDMLLSMYVSFRLSSDLEQKNVIHVLLMTGFIIVMSVLSTFVCILWLWIILLYPFWLVSFPFLSTPKLFFGDRGHLISYNINFFWMKIVSISPQNVLAYGFSFFFLINLVGAMLGYWINKKLLNEPFKWKLFDFLFRSGIWSFLACYAIIWLDWFALQLIVWYGVNDIWLTIVSSTSFFCRYFFWVPATIATAIYGIYKRPEKDARARAFRD